MANFVLNAEAREVAQQGKGSSRRLRHAAKVQRSSMVAKLLL